MNSKREKVEPNARENARKRKVANLLARINKEIFQAIWDEVNKTTGKEVSKRAIYYRIEAIREEFNYTISSKTAANLLASRMGIDVYRILEKSDLDELRGLLKLSIPTIPKVKRVKRPEEERLISIGKKVIEAFLLPPNLAKEAERMADVYPDIYVFENTLRYVVMSVLKQRHGENWWYKSNIVSNRIRKEVEKRKKKEGKNRWHSVRGTHEVFYTNFGDLSSIIATNWNDFKTIFPDLNWIQSRMYEIEQSRNIIAHNNPLPTREVNRIKLYYGDLKKQLGKTDK